MIAVRLPMSSALFPLASLVSIPGTKVFSVSLLGFFASLSFAPRQNGFFWEGENAKCKERHINGGWKRQMLSPSHPLSGCSSWHRLMAHSPQVGFAFSPLVSFDRSDTKLCPRNIHHHFRAPDLNCAQDVFRACQGTLTHAPGKMGGSNCFLDGITEAWGGFVGALSRPGPKATFRITQSPSGQDEIFHMGCVIPNPCSARCGDFLAVGCSSPPQKLFPLHPSALELPLVGASLGWDREPGARWDFDPMDKILVQCPGEGCEWCVQGIKEAQRSSFVADPP